jgi:GNAT superfamily N-acetyltransferase
MADITYCTNNPDRDSYFTLFETTGWNATYKASPEDLARALGNSWYILSAYDEGKLVGFGRVMCDGSLHAMIFDLIVHPSHQRRGIGSEILGRILSVCRNAGIRDIQLFAAHGKAPFYEKHGFCLRPDNAPGMELAQHSS